MPTGSSPTAPVHGGGESDLRCHHLMTPAVFQILLSLSDGSRHGYGIMREIDERTGGEVHTWGPGPSTDLSAV